MKKRNWILFIALIGIIGAILILPYNDSKDINTDEDDIDFTEIEGEEAEDTIIRMMELEENIDISKVMNTISLIDFDKLADLHGEDSVLNLLRWLGTQEIEGKENIVILINLMDEFIGQEYFAYIQSIANAYLNDKIQFIKALAQVPESLEDVGYALNNMRVYDIEDQDMWEDLDMITNLEELNENERKIGIELIHFYSACST